ncbi:MAG: alpha-L-glutamate ligase [Acidobacteriota bacterium]|nr:alpha-L-glutamate ligase [Acidobacteriota bacterium]
MTEAKIYILHENKTWVEPLSDALAELGIDTEDIDLSGGHLPLDELPAEGVYYNRVSASSYLRDHMFAPELARNLIRWLENSGRRVINDTRALEIELSKLHHYDALRKTGIRVPRTHAAVGRSHLVQAAQAFVPGPFIIKPNRGGKGAGVKKFDTIAELEAWLDSPDYVESGDGVWLVQEYIQAPDHKITRFEFVGGKYLYSAQVDTRSGFELCPAEFCTLEQARERFRITDRYADHPIVAEYEEFLAENGVEIAGIEMIEDEDGTLYTYDVNTNTNYNQAAEFFAQVPVSGMSAVANYLAEELAAAMEPKRKLALAS